jgi:hypothetical protein
VLPRGQVLPHTSLATNTGWCFTSPPTSSVVLHWSSNTASCFTSPPTLPLASLVPLQYCLVVNFSHKNIALLLVATSQQWRSTVGPAGRRLDQLAPPHRRATRRRFAFWQHGKVETCELMKGKRSEMPMLEMTGKRRLREHSGK